jgi:Mrp family chromosome partitioning ATPase
MNSKNTSQNSLTANLESPPANFPVYLTSFVGQERELAEIGKLLKQASLLSLTGTGGVGKTRLAVQFARALSAEKHFPDGIRFVELAPLSDERYIV